MSAAVQASEGAELPPLTEAEVAEIEADLRRTMAGGAFTKGEGAAFYQALRDIAAGPDAVLVLPPVEVRL